MTTDKQRALAAIDCLNNARELLENSTDQAQHDIAEDIGLLLTQLESLKFDGLPLAPRGLVSVCTDYDVAIGQPGRYLITEEHNDGYIIIARFAKLADAKRALAQMEG